MEHARNACEIEIEAKRLVVLRAMLIKYMQLSVSTSKQSFRQMAWGIRAAQRPALRLFLGTERARTVVAPESQLAPESLQAVAVDIYSTCCQPQASAATLIHPKNW